MSSTSLYRLSRASLLTGGVILAIGILADFLSGGDQASALAVATAFMRLAGVLFLLLGFPGVYARHAAHSGKAGLVGFVLIFLALGLAGAFETILAIVMPFLAAHGLGNGHMPASGFVYLLISDLLLLVGGIVFGISILRNRYAPRWSGIMLIIGTLVSVLGGIIVRPIGDIGTVVMVIALCWFAAALETESSVVQVPARPATA
jgi:hypothetical protein